MQQSRFSEQQIAFILQQADEGVGVEGGVPKGGHLDPDLLPVAAGV